MHYLVTGGCGFIGSHLCESLLQAGHRVTVIDDLSTGRIANIDHLEGNDSFDLLVGSVTDGQLVQEAVVHCDAIFHLASAVGVKLIMEQPVETIDTIVTGTQRVLEIANRLACSPYTFLTACVSAASPRGVLVPCAFT